MAAKVLRILADRVEAISWRGKRLCRKVAEAIMALDGWCGGRGRPVPYP